MRALLLCCTLAASLALAAARPAGAAGTGVGVIAGEPTGLSLKTWLDAGRALDAGLGWSFSGHTRLHAHVDHLWHDFALLRPGGVSGRVPVYFGIGGRFRLADSGDRGEDGDDRLGVRFPLGLAWEPARPPLDVFVEIAPVLDLVPGTELDLGAAIGLRYWLR